jgi:hypothetical protein
MTLANYLAEADAAPFVISMVLEDLPAVLSKMDHRTAEIVTKSRLALAGLQNPHFWSLRTTPDARRYAKRVGEAGGAVTLIWLRNSTSSNGGKIASTAAQ